MSRLPQSGMSPHSEPALTRSANSLPRYAIAIGTVTFATVARLLLDPFIGSEFPFITFFAASAFAAWLGGIGPAVLAVVLGYLAADYFFISSRQTLAILHPDTATIAGAATFLFINSLIAALAIALRRALARSKDAGRREYEQRRWLEVTIASIGDAVVVTDANGHVTLMNVVAEQLTGWTLSEALGRPLRDIFIIVNEYTRAPVDNPCAKVMATGIIVGLANHTVLISKDGTERPIDDSAAPIKDEKGRLNGVVLVFRDVTERRDVEFTLKQQSERLRLAVQAGRIGVWDWDVKSNHFTWSDRMCEIYGVSRGALGDRYEDFLAFVHPDDRGRVEQAFRQALENNEPFEVEFRIQQPDGGVRYLSTAAVVVRVDIEKAKVHGATRDITTQNRTREVLEFLARASGTLSTLVDRESALRQAARMSLPFLADWSSIHLVNDQGNIEMEACAHVLPEKEKILCDILEGFPLDWNSKALTGRVLRTGNPELISEVSDTLLDNLADSPQHLALVRKLEIHSFVSVPVRMNNRIVGVMAFGITESDRRFEQEDLQVALDFAERVSSALANAQLVYALKQADRQKDDFLAMLAHELRNPLAAIQYANAISQMSGGSNDPEVRDIIDRQVNALGHLIDDLLDVSRITRGKIQLKRDYVDLSLVAKRALATARPAIEGKRHEVRIEIPDLGLTVHADPVRLEQIILNLLNNAAKYTPEGGKIGLRVEQQDGEALVIVQDNGIGIPREMLPQIFELFAQVDPTIDRSEGGLGIGLTVVRRLIEMHGGTVTASSEGLGRGSQFSIRLPLAVAPVSVLEPEESKDSQAGPLRILAVDDNRDTVDVLAKLLNAMGHEVRAAYDGLSALNIAREYKPDVCLLDIGLPAMNGYQVAKTLRDEGFQSITLVAISGYGQHEDRERSKKAGFDHHLTKPVDFGKLQAILSSVPAK